MKHSPELLFSEYAWHKLKYLYDKSVDKKTEISFCGISTAEKPLYVKDVVMPKQKGHSTETEWDSEDISEFVNQMLDKGYKPEEFFRIWIHTHPGFSCNPSGHDEKQIVELFGNVNFGVMAIMGKDHKMSAHLILNYKSLRTITEIPVKYELPDYSEHHEKWDEEIEEAIIPTAIVRTNYNYYGNGFYEGSGLGVGFGRSYYQRKKKDEKENGGEIIIEDDEDVREMLRNILFSIEWAASGKLLGYDPSEYEEHNLNYLIDECLSNVEFCLLDDLIAVCFGEQRLFHNIPDDELYLMLEEMFDYYEMDEISKKDLKKNWSLLCKMKKEADTQDKKK